MVISTPPTLVSGGGPSSEGGERFNEALFFEEAGINVFAGPVYCSDQMG